MHWRGPTSVSSSNVLELTLRNNLPVHCLYDVFGPSAALNSGFVETFVSIPLF